MTRHRTPRTGPRAIALVEVVVSIGILGGLMAAVLNAVGAAAVSRSRTIERLQGAALGESMMAEILACNYTDTTPPGGLVNVNVTILGVTVTLTTPGGTATRATFDAIDDYNGWTATPPIARDGSVIPGYTGWMQSVVVERVALLAPNGAAAGSDTGLKRITVVITRNGREISRTVALRSRAWEGVLSAR